MKQPTRVDTDANADAALGDATVNPTTGLQGSLMHGFNGTTWDRIRTAVVTPSATLTGILSVLGWAQYKTTPTTRTDGQSGPLQADSSGNLLVSLSTSIAGEDIPNDLLKVEEAWSITNITTNTTTTVKTGAGTFGGFTINNNGFTTAGTITIYDNTAGSGTKIGTYTLPLQPPGSVVLSTPWFPPQMLKIRFTVGLTFVTATTAPAADITVMYR